MSLIELLRQADSYLDIHDFQAAKECLEKALTFDMEVQVKNIIYEQLGMCCINLNNTIDAMIYLEILISNEEYDGIYDASVCLAKLYRDANRFEDMYRIGKKINKISQPENSLIQPEQLYYELWCRQNEPVTVEIEKQRHIKFKYEPKISIVVPVYNVKIEYLIEMFNTVIFQTYTNWELCFADGNSSNEKIRETIHQYSEKDSRIKYVFLEDNLGISENTNAAIMLSTGEYIAFLDHDDCLTPDALYEIAKAIEADKELQMIYTDHDQIEMFETEFIRTKPQFKPDWSPMFFEYVNYIIHFVIVKRELLMNIGLLKKEYDGCQDTEVLFRITENTNKILHIPKILYNWRIHPESTRASIDESRLKKKYLLMIAEHFTRINVLYKKINSDYLAIVIRNNPKVSIIIINKDNYLYLKKCIKTIFSKAGYANFEIIIVDKGSTDKDVLLYYEALKQKKFATILLRRDSNQNDLSGMAYDYNFGSKYASGEYLLFMDAACEFKDNDWMYAFLQCQQYNSVGLTGCGVNYIDEGGNYLYFSGIQYTGSSCGIKNMHSKYRKKVILCPDEIKTVNSGERVNFRNATALDSACVMIKKEFFNSFGGFDLRFPYTFYVFDLCLKLRQASYYNVWINGYELNYVQEKQIYYKNALKYYENEIEMFEAAHRSEIAMEDPFMNINFSVDNYKKNSCLFNIQSEG